MKERVVSIGKPTPLSGVLCEPDEPLKGRPTVLIFNSGIMHHIGTCRTSVKLARSLAATGISSLRFDYSGIGDSEARRGSVSFSESAHRETTEVMEFMHKRRGSNQFVLYGLCSGADAAYEIAQHDDRVIGICQIDAYSYKTVKWYVKHYVGKLVQPRQWPAYTRRLVARFTNKAQQNEYFELPSYVRIFPPRSEVANGLQKIADRGVFIYSIFTRNRGVNYQSQFRESMRSVNFRGRLTVDYIPQAEHIIPEPDCQELIVDNIVKWVASIPTGNRDNRVGVELPLARR